MGNLGKNTVNIYINQQPAIDALHSLQAQADKLTEKIALGEKAGKNMTAAITQLGKTKEQIAAVQKQIDSGLTPTMNQLRSAINKANAELSKMSGNDPGFKAQAEKVKALSAEYEHLKSQSKTVQSESIKLEEGFKRLGLRVLEYIGIYGAIDTVVGFFKTSIEEINKEEQAITQLKNALDNAGRSDLFDRFSDSAEKFGEKFKAINPNDIKNVFTKLIDYGKLSEAQINSLTEVIINYAAKQKISLEASADVMTKALEGNVKGLRTYGIAIGSAHTVTERFGLIVNELGNKVSGAEAVFENTRRGGLAKFGEAIVQIKEKFGEFLFDMLKGGKSAEELFDKAKEKTESYERSLNPLLLRYDELKSKTSLNKGEQTELHGIIQKIVALVPNAATEFNKYGDALDINRGKAAEFIKVNKQLLAQKEADAINSNISTIRENLNQLDRISKVLNGGSGFGIQAGKATDQQKQNFLSLKASLQISTTEIVSNLKQKFGVEVPKDLKASTDAIISIVGAVDAVDKKIAKQDSTKVIGGGNPNADPEGDKRRASEFKKHAEEIARLRKEFEELTTKIFEATAADDAYLKGIRAANDEAEKEIKLVKDLYSKKIISSQEFAETNLKIEEARLAKLRKLYDQFAKDGQIPTSADPFAKLAITGDVKRDFTKDVKRTTDAALDAAENKVLASKGKKKLEAQKNQLDLEMAAELANTNLTEEQKALIEEKYRQKKMDLDKQAWKKTAEEILSAASAVLNLATVINQGLDAADQQKEQVIEKTRSKEEQRLKRNLDNKLISQKEYDRQISAMNKKADKEKHDLEVKQFKRQQALAIAQALISGAQTVLQIMGTTSWAALGTVQAILIALAGATTLAEIAVISKQKPPAFAKGKGGVPIGPTHADGGINLIDSRTGRKVGEMEGEEPILSKATYRNNRKLIDQLLYSSMYANGAPIKPYWQTQPYRAINYSGISQSITRMKMYDRGGIGPSTTTTTNNVTNNEMQFDEMMNRFNAVVDKLDNVVFKTYVVVGEVNAANDVLDNIKQETTISRK